MISYTSLISLLPFFLAAAAVDPKVACIQGHCSYSSGDGNNTAYSVLAINTEKATSLSDITTAAGWDIIECDPYSVGPQDVRLVCTDRSKGCDHLFEGGEENTIVRLPEDCAGGPFARVVKSWIPDNQTVPARLAKRASDEPVRALTLDFDFKQIPESNGKVYITASATNSQVQRNALRQAVAKRSIQPLRHASRSAMGHAAVRDFVQASQNKRSGPSKRRRGIFDSIGDAFSHAGDAISDAAGDVKDAIVGGAEQVADGATKAGDAIEHAVDGATNAVGDFVHSIGDFNKTDSKTLNVLDINQSFPVITASLSCPGAGPRPGFEASIAVTAAVRAKVDADVGFIVTGSLVPPKIDDLAFTSNMHGNVGAIFDIKANVKGVYDTGKIPLLEAGLPGLSVPGILTVGPKISLNVQGKLSLGVTADIKVSSVFDLPNVNLVFPPSQGESHAEVVPGNTPIKVDVGTSVELKGRAEVHIIPQLDFGIEILEGAAKTTVFLNVDGSAGVDLSLSTGASFNAVNGTNEAPVVGLNEVETKFGGSVGADMGVSINAGATAALKPFFDQTVSITLFSKVFPIFKKTFGNPAVKRSIEERQEKAATPSTSGLICPASGDINIKQPILDAPDAIPQQP